MKRNEKGLKAESEGALATTRSGIVPRMMRPRRSRIARSTVIAAFCFFPILSAGTAWAQSEIRARANDLSINATVENYRDDFSSGIRITSPYLLWNHLAFTAAANLAFREGALDTNPGTSVWIPYGVYRIGAIGTSGLIADNMRFYGHGGLLFVAPDARFSSSKFLWGGYGAFGFEFFVTPAKALPLSYFIELGTNGITAKADLMAGDPRYLNGFASTVGLKVYF